MVLLGTALHVIMQSTPAMRAMETAFQQFTWRVEPATSMSILFWQGIHLTRPATTRMTTPVPCQSIVRWRRTLRTVEAKQNKICVSFFVPSGRRLPARCAPWRPARA